MVFIPFLALIMSLFDEVRDKFVKFSTSFLHTFLYKFALNIVIQPYCKSMD